MLTRDVGTLAECEGESVRERYNRCGLLNTIQHIDIFGKFRSSYIERARLDSLIVSSISSSRQSSKGSSDSIGDVESKLGRFSVSTKLSGLYPGHDILGRKAKLAARRNVAFGAFVPR